MELRTKLAVFVELTLYVRRLTYLQLGNLKEYSI